MNSQQNYIDGVLRQQWSLGVEGAPQPEGYIEFDAGGVEVSRRPLTEAEIAGLQPVAIPPTPEQRIDALVADNQRQQQVIDELTDLVLFGEEPI